MIVYLVFEYFVSMFPKHGVIYAYTSIINGFNACGSIKKEKNFGDIYANVLDNCLNIYYDGLE